MGELSSAAHRNKFRTLTIGGVQLSRVKFLDGNKNQDFPKDAQGYVLSDDNGTVYVAMRGTYSSEDVHDDLKLKLVAAPEFGLDNKCVHAGFLDQFKSIKGKLQEALEGLTYTRIVFCGHSLGGALAIIASYWYATQRFSFRKDIRVYTFGSPRVGTNIFNSRYKKVGRLRNILLMRVCCDEDPVPNEPTPLYKYNHMTFGYTLTLYASKEPKFVENSPDNGRWENVVSFCTKALFWHSMDSCYLPRIKKFVFER